MGLRRWDVDKEEIGTIFIKSPCRGAEWQWGHVEATGEPSGLEVGPPHGISFSRLRFLQKTGLRHMVCSMEAFVNSASILGVSSVLGSVCPFRGTGHSTLS